MAPRAAPITPATVRFLYIPIDASPHFIDLDADKTKIKTLIRQGYPTLQYHPHPGEAYTVYRYFFATETNRNVHFYKGDILFSVSGDDIGFDENTTVSEAMDAWKQIFEWEN